MYANLRVLIGRQVDTVPHALYEESVFAWAVDIAGTTATLSLDGQDGSGSYAEPAGVRTVDLSTHAIRIEADF